MILLNLLNNESLNKFLADRKIFIGVDAIFLPDNIKIMLHFEISQRNFF